MRVFGQPHHTVFRGPVLTMAFGTGLLAGLRASPASADGSSPPPSGSPTPTPTPPPGLTTWQPAAPIPTPAPKSAAPATPIPSTSASPSPSVDPAEARARDAALLANATSLAQIIDAQARVARDELAALDEQVAQVSKDLDEVNADIATVQTRSAERGTIHERLARDAFRLAALSASPVPAAISQAQRDALDDLRSLETGLAAVQAKLTDRAAVLSQLTESVGAQQAHLARLRGRARVLAAAAAGSDSEARAAQVAVLQALAQDAAAAQTSLAHLAPPALVQAGVATPPRSLPPPGPATQPSGPPVLPPE